MPFSRDQFEVTTYLGSMVGAKSRFLKSIACMTPEWREIVAYLEILKMLPEFKGKENKDKRAEINRIIKICQKIGQSQFKMDIISHLSMFVGGKSQTYDAEATKK